jgi:phosphoribosylglycinamide formyltransferase-1
MKKIAIFASGSGTNFENITQYFKNTDIARVTMLVCNKLQAGVIARAQKLRVPAVLISDRTLKNPQILLETLQSEEIDMIVLAGFLKLMPQILIEAYPHKILNIHPALLPQYGGRGMYGNHVHNAVVLAGEKNSGITVHYVNAQYDEGEILFQQMTVLAPDETPETLAQKIQALEYLHYPRVIEKEIHKIFK